MTDGARWPAAGAAGHVVAAAGETMAAFAPSAGGGLERAGAFRLDVAGAESNVAMYLADHGVAARWVSAVGDDPIGRRVLARVAASGVDVSGVRTDPARPTGVMVKDPGPDRTRVHYYRRGSAASALGPGLLAAPAVRTATVLHLTGITPALSPSCRALVETALAEPRESRPHAISFDVNLRPALWDEPPGATLRDLASRADIVFVGLDEARALWGGHLAGAAAVRALLPEPRVLVVKDGPHAATAFHRGSAVTVPALRVEVREVVGAGDAFAAGFLAGLLGSRDPVHALRLAHLTAASALRVTGDHGPLPPPSLTRHLLTADATTWSSASVTDETGWHAAGARRGVS
jgi:2-dehydro-3-deoxygluconokinase